MNVEAQRISPAPIRRSLRVKASQDKAFRTFVAGMGSWWLKSHSLNPAGQKDVLIEPRAGGRWYEKGVDGSECDWGKVLVWEPPSRVVLSWHLNSQFKVDDAVDSEVDVRFIAESADSTRVELEHRLTAVDGEAIRAQVDAPNGWSGLLALYAQSASRG